MASIHIDMANRAYREAVTAGFAPMIEDYRDKIRSKAWPEWYTDVLCQPHGSLGREQVLMFTHLHALAQRGEIGIVPVYVGAGPGNDSSRDANAAKIRRLPSPFTAEVDPHQSNDTFGDGTLAWSDGIEVAFGCRCCHTEEYKMWAPPGACSLEIGTCPPSRILMYLNDSGSVARWPYGQDRIYLIVGLPTPIEFAAARHYLMREERPAAVPRQTRARRSSGAKVRHDSPGCKQFELPLWTN